MSEIIRVGENSVTTVELADGAVTLAKMADVAPSRILGQQSGVAAGPPTAMTPTQTRTVLGIDEPLQVRKGTPGTVAKGTPYRVSGYNPSGFIEIEAADAAAAATMPAVCIASQDITNAATLDEPAGTHTVTGIKTDYAGWAEGNDLYVANGGGLTKTKPTGTDLIQKVAEVLRVHSSQGAIIVFGAGRTNDIPNLPQLNAWIGDATGVPQATSLVNTDGRMWVPAISGDKANGTWAVFGGSGSNYVVRRTAAAAQGIWLCCPSFPTRGTALRGRMPTAVRMVYSVTTAAADDVQCSIYVQTVPADNSGMAAIALLAGAANNSHYDSNHDSAAKRGADDGGGGVEYHTCTVTVPTPAYIGADEGIVLYCNVTDAAGAAVVELYGFMLHYTETLVG